MSVTAFCVCGRKLKAKDEAAGRTAICPDCGARVRLPEKATATDRDETVPASGATSRAGQAGIEPQAAVPPESAEPAEAPAPQGIPGKMLALLNAILASLKLYQIHRAALLRGLLNRLPTKLTDDTYRWRNIRVVRSTPVAGCGWEEDHWQIRLPAACVSCGYTKEVAGDSLDCDAIDSSGPVNAILIAAACVPALLLLRSGWLWLLSLPALPVLLWRGMRNVTSERVRVECFRCSEHRSDPEWPQVSLSRDTLSIVSGNARVRKLWLRDQRPERPFPDADQFRNALTEARNRDYEQMTRIPRAARAAGWIWLMIGRLQWIAALIEMGAIMLADLQSGLNSPASVRIILICYVAFRFRVAQAFRESGQKMLDREAEDTLSFGAASLIMGLLLSVPTGLIFSGVRLFGMETSFYLGDPASKAFLLSLMAWGILLLLAGLLALIGRKAYLGQISRRRKAIIDVPCPMCRGSYGVFDPGELDTLVICHDCGEAFRLKAPDS